MTFLYVTVTVLANIYVHFRGWFSAGVGDPRAGGPKCLPGPKYFRLICWWMDIDVQWYSNTDNYERWGLDPLNILCRTAPEYTDWLHSIFFAIILTVMFLLQTPKSGSGMKNNLSSVQQYRSTLVIPPLVNLPNSLIRQNYTERINSHFRTTH